VSLETKVYKVGLASPEQQECPGLLVHPARKDPKDSLGLKDLRGPLVHKVPKDSKVSSVCKVLKDPKASQVYKAQLVLKACLDLQDRLAQFQWMFKLKSRSS
jgi:hypothetical protein